VRLLFFPRSDVEIIDTWHVGGLRGTGSHDYRVQDLFVPAHRTCWFTEEPVEPGPLYTLPLITMSTALMAGVVLGIARHALDALEELAAVKTPRAQTVVREDPVARVRIGEAEGLLRAGQAFLYRTLEETWDIVRREGHLGQEQHGRVIRTLRPIAKCVACSVAPRSHPQSSAMGSPTSTPAAMSRSRSHSASARP
jgi:alkylation response protein AidB-like acyl-CoA dehydrogenase